MEKGIIYFIQPHYLIETNRYKIGCSVKHGLDSIKNSYKEGTRIIYLNECDNPFELKGIIKKKFSQIFKLIAGNAYFSGNETMMLNEFIEIIDNYNKLLNK
jgi:calcineurin-like phosphoesterase